jgi:hypothetical protein
VASLPRTPKSWSSRTSESRRSPRSFMYNLHPISHREVYCTLILTPYTAHAPPHTHDTHVNRAC